MGLSMLLALFAHKCLAWTCFPTQVRLLFCCSWRTSTIGVLYLPHRAWCCYPINSGIKGVCLKCEHCKRNGHGVSPCFELLSCAPKCSRRKKTESPYHLLVLPPKSTWLLPLLLGWIGPLLAVGCWTNIYMH